MKRIVVPQQVDGEYGGQQVSLKLGEYRWEFISTTIVSPGGSTDPLVQMHMLTPVLGDRAIPISIEPEAMDQLRQRAVLEIEE